MFFKDLCNLQNPAKRAENMTDKCREYGRWDEMILAQEYNGIKSMFDFYVAEYVTRKR